jgi:hypothetical protein
LPPTKTKKSYITVAFSKDLYDQITEFLHKDKRHGFVSVSEFLKDAARRRLEELRSIGARTQDSPAAKGTGKFCSNCGAELKGPFCTQCGTKA